MKKNSHDFAGSSEEVGESLVYNEQGKMLCEMAWDNRHHVTPSLFNRQNHSYYKQYFDKN